MHRASGCVRQRSAAEGPLSSAIQHPGTANWDLQSVPHSAEIQRAHGFGIEFGAAVHSFALHCFRLSERKPSAKRGTWQKATESGTVPNGREHAIQATESKA